MGHAMSGLDVLQSVQFVTIRGRKFALLSLEDWDALLDWLETIDDIQAARRAIEELKAAGGDPEKAGWLEWSKVAGELE